MATNCQVCGNPMFSNRDMGINGDGSINSDFCSGCYRQGRFISGDGDGSGMGNDINIPLLAIGAIGLSAGAARLPDGAWMPGAIAPVVIPGLMPDWDADIVSD